MPDISHLLVAKSDQLNADDLIGGPIVVKIIDVTVSNATEQPVAIKITGHRPWKPCKTTMRQLTAAWGANSDNWIGKWVKLWRDPTVMWAGNPDGGVRIAALSHIKAPMDDRLAISKGKKSKFHVDVLVPPDDPTAPAAEDGPMDLATFRKWCGAALKHGWTRDQVAAIIGADKAEDVPENDRREIVARLKGEPPVTPDEAPATDAAPPADAEPATDAEPTPTEST